MQTPKARLRLAVRIGLLTVLGSGLAAGLFFVAFHPPTDDSYYPKCTLHSATGLHCPGCGLTRSVYSVLNGDFLQAVAYNAFAPILLPIMFFGVIRGVWFTIFPAPALPRDAARPRKSRLMRWFPTVLAVVLIVFGVVRNIPIYPLTLLAPHEISP